MASIEELKWSASTALAIWSLLLIIGLPLCIWALRKTGGPFTAGIIATILLNWGEAAVYVWVLYHRESWLTTHASRVVLWALALQGAVLAIQLAYAFRPQRGSEP